MLNTPVQFEYNVQKCTSCNS